MKLPNLTKYDAGSDDTLRRARLAVRRRWPIIVGVTILMGLAAFGYVKSRPKQYTATAYLAFGPNDLSTVTQRVAGVGEPIVAVAQGQIDTNILRLRQSNTALLTAHSIGHGLTAGQVSDSIVLTPQGQSSIVSVAATATSPTRAADIANTYVRQFVDAERLAARAMIRQAQGLVRRKVASLSRAALAAPDGQSLLDREKTFELLGKIMSGNVGFLRAAEPPTAASSAGVTKVVGLGVLAGLVLGLALAFLLERLDRRLKEADDLERAVGFPLLGQIPEIPAFSEPLAPDEPLTLGDEMDAFRMLRAQLRRFNIDREVKVILMTSIQPGDGTSTVARNLALSSASIDTRTLLIEADLRNPSLAQRLGLKPDPGVAETLVSHDCGWQAVQRIPLANANSGSTAGSPAGLDILVAGAIAPNPGELLEGQPMRDLIAKARTEYDLVIIDAPPISVVSDATALMPVVDGVLVVARLGKYTDAEAHRFNGILESVAAPVLGVVVNAIKTRDRGDGYRPSGRADGAAPAEPAETSDGAAIEAQGTSLSGSDAEHTKVG